MKYENFRLQMAEHGLDPGEIKPDGVIHRFPTWGDSADEMAGSYWHNGEVGWFQDWRTMEKPEIVRGELTEADKKALNGSFTGANNRVTRKALEAGIRRIWSAGAEPDGHPYLRNKGISAPPHVKQHDGCLIIPVFGINSELNGLQRIDANGRKRFLAGTRKKGSFFSIPGNGTYLICEGFSTGVSLHEATGASIAVAFDAGNLVHVAKAVSTKVGPENIIIAGDNDAWRTAQGKENVGTVRAEKAAKEIGCRVIVPKFQKPDGKSTTDFNDLHRLAGANAVRAQVDSAEQIKNEISGNDLENEIASIADLPLLAREIEIERISKENKISKTIIKAVIKGLQNEVVDDVTRLMAEPEPWESEVNGTELLNTILKKLNHHVVLPPGAAPPIAAFVLFTYCYDAFWNCPILAIVSVIKRSGKTTTLETIQGIVNKGVPASNITAAVVFRVIQDYKPTLLIDEADSYLKNDEALRGVLNSGHSRLSAWVWRSDGDDNKPKIFSTWAPKAIAMIGELPPTIEDRSIVITLQRKTPGETVSPLSMNYKKDCEEIRRKCRRWADDNFNKLLTVRPNMIKTNNDRQANNWTPLCAIAEVVGGEWPELIRKSMSQMIDSSEEEIIVTLLRDIRGIFETNGVDRIFSDNLVEGLKELAESPWVDWSRGRGLSQNGLAKLLKQCKIRSKNIRIYEEQRKGYELKSFKDSFKRLLPPLGSVPTYHDNDFSYLDKNKSVPEENAGTDGKQANLLKLQGWDAGTDKNPIFREKEEKEFNEATGLWS